MQSQSDTGTCYCCEAKATSKEHAPPKCIFPEAKDANGKDFRKALITVPSCDAHNTAKSKDDEYLLGVLALNIVNNTKGSDQAKSKVLRAVKRSGGLAQELLGDTMPVVLKNTETNETEKSVAVRIDTNRVNSALKQIALAIFHHHYGRRYEGDVDCLYEGLVTIESEDPVKANQDWQNFRNSSEKLFKHAICHGENPDIFVYQIVEPPENGRPIVMRLKFYGANNCTILFK
jgi:hypothetical protein